MLFFKKRLPLAVAGIFTLLLGAGCDTIEPPYMTGPGNGNNDNGDTVRKVLLEEFTGHHCPNCPDASFLAKELQAYYGDRMIIVSVHAGWFARVSEPPFDSDYTTPTGDALDTHFGVSHNPIGMVNRTPYAGSVLLSPSAWGEAIEQTIGTSPVVLIDLSVDYDDSTRQISIEAEVEAVETLESPVYLSLYLKENGIVSAQRTNDDSYPSGIIEDYEHNHVLRLGINGTWGDQLSEAPFLQGDVIQKGYSVTLDQEWDPHQCTVVAFVYDASTMEILQAEKHSVH